MLPYAILGFLIDRPLHGYELKRVVSPAVSRERLLNDGILYPLLARMARDGHVRRAVERQRGRPSRHVYSVTSKGRAHFLAWLRTTVQEEDEVTYDFLLGHPFLAKCMFFAHLRPAARRDKLAAQRMAATAKLADFARIRAGMVERRVDRFRIAVLDLGIAQQRAKIRWLEQLGRSAARAQPLRRKRA